MIAIDIRGRQPEDFSTEESDDLLMARLDVVTSVPHDQPGFSVRMHADRDHLDDAVGDIGLAPFAQRVDDVVGLQVQTGGRVQRRSVDLVDVTRSRSVDGIRNGDEEVLHAFHVGPARRRVEKYSTTRSHLLIVHIGCLCTPLRCFFFPF